MTALQVLATLQTPDGRTYLVPDVWFASDDPDSAYRYWTAGNYSCDCNRSRMIRRLVTGLPKMPCGESIELVTLVIDGEVYVSPEEAPPD